MHPLQYKKDHMVHPLHYNKKLAVDWKSWWKSFFLVCGFIEKSPLKFLIMHTRKIFYILGFLYRLSTIKFPINYQWNSHFFSYAILFRRFFSNIVKIGHFCWLFCWELYSTSFYLQYTPSHTVQNSTKKLATSF